MKQITNGKKVTSISSKPHAYNTGLLQGRAYRILNNSLTSILVRYNMSIPEWKLLGQLYEHGAMKPADLADLLDVEAPLVTSLIEKLEKKMLVKKTHHPKDKRAKIITITTKGKKMISHIEPQVKLAMGALFKGVTKQHLVSYIHVLQTIVTNVS